jgi:hypothetical protein
MRVKLIAASLSSLVILGCGGGGGGGGGSDSSSTGGGASTSYSLEIPTKLTSLPASGNAFSSPNITDYGIGTAIVPNSTETGLYSTQATYYRAESASFQLFPTTHLTNEVRSSWNNGWNGQGITISVIDDFLSGAISVTKSTPSFTQITDYAYSGSSSRSTSTSSYTWTNQYSHGDLVANIAGGDFDGLQQTIAQTARSSSPVISNCTTLTTGGGFTLGCSSYPQYFSSTRTINLSYRKVAGVAMRANVVSNNVNLSSRQNPIQTVADIQGHLQNSAYLGVINLSMGSDIPTSGRTLNEVMTEVSRFPLSRVDAVVVVAAGNGGAACATQDLNGCNSLAVAMAYQAATKGSTIVVGALSGSGSSENIATYSTRAGILSQRFVLASGEQGETGVVGTSFAAPRVAGIAAILKQRYPSLSASQIANIILLSASKDINNDGVDDFTGVSPIYGHGKVSLTRALALAGAL